MFSIGVFAVIFDEQQRVLLCHRRDMDAWNLPGGAVESGALPTEAVVREAKDETGFDITVERLVGVYGKANNKNEIVFSFLCKVSGGQLTMTDEVDECRYWEVDRLSPNTIPKHIGRIHDALKSPEQLIFRRQTEPSIRDVLSGRP